MRSPESHAVGWPQRGPVVERLEWHHGDDEQRAEGDQKPQVVFRRGRRRAQEGSPNHAEAGAVEDNPPHGHVPRDFVGGRLARVQQLLDDHEGQIDKGAGAQGLKRTTTPRVDPMRSGAFSISIASTVVAARERTALTWEAGWSQEQAVAVKERRSTHAITWAPTR